MGKTKETKNETTNGNGKKSKDDSVWDQKESKAYKSMMKAFEMTHRRLFPELYKTKVSKTKKING